MVRCEICGSPMLRVRPKDGAWQMKCLHGCSESPCEAPTGEPGARDAAEQAAAGLAWYGLESVNDEALDRAEDAFHAAVKALPGDAALRWAELLSRYGVRQLRVGADAALLLWRFELNGRLLGEDADFDRLMDVAAGTDALEYYRAEAAKVDRLLDQARLLDEDGGYDVFLSLKTEDDGVTEEKLLCDRIYDQLTQVYGVGRVFYAPKTLQGRVGDDFEALIHRGLATAKVLLLTAASRDHVDAPWLRSEWQRYMNRDDGRLVVCCMGELRHDQLPAALASRQGLRVEGVDDAGAGSVAGQIFKLLSAPSEKPPENHDAQFARARSLLEGHPEKAVELLKKAAAGKHAPSQLLLGRCYERGIGAEANYKEARRWYMAAAGRGLASARTAMNALALRQEAERGSVPAQSQLGALYLNGDGEPEPEEAARWLAMAAEAGDASALYLYGTMLAEGRGVAQDRRLARKMLLEARRKGNREAADYVKKRKLGLW